MSSVSDRFWGYVKDVESGKVLTNKWMKLVMKRFRKDLEKSKDEAYPYEFRLELSERIIRFTEMMKQTDSLFAGKTLTLLPWQVFVFGMLAGWVRKDDHSIRRFRKAWLYVARKNGKSVMVSSWALWDLLSTPGAQVHLAATTRAQAKIVYNVVSAMVDQNEALSNRLKQYKSTATIVNESSYGKLTALSSESKKNADGLSTSLGIFDECSASDEAIYKIIESGQGARPSPLNILISSGSDKLDSMGKQEFDRACKILQGILEDDTYFTVLYCLDEGDDWLDESKYIKANPSLGYTLKPDFLHKLKVQAEQQPSLQTEFKTKCLGLWCSNEHSWINYKYWQVCSDNAKKYKFDPEKVYYANLGIDLSKSNDLTTLTLCLYQEGRYFMQHWLYFPEDSFAERVRTETEQWRQWMDNGVVTAVPGKTIDYDWLLKQVEEIASEYEIEEVLYDPYCANKVIPELENSLTVVPIPQHLKNLSPYTKAYEKEILDGNIVDGNDMMKWCMSNAMVFTDANGNIKVLKNSRMGKDVRDMHIDPVITSLMCVGRIKSLLDSGDIDLRTPEESAADLEKLLTGLGF